MERYAVYATQTVYLKFEVDAESPTDAAERATIDGIEVGREYSDVAVANVETIEAAAERESRQAYYQDPWSENL